MKDGTRTTQGRGRLFDSVLDAVGDTPCIRINRIAPEGVTVYVKAEAFNPAGSVKDRLALNIIEAAERDGSLKPGQTVVEATSGNTGIGLAMVCAAKGYPLVVTMADSFSVERRRLMRFLGAKVILTPRQAKGFGMVEKAKELAEKNGWFLAHQFETAANADIHEGTTGREILKDFEGKKLDYFVSGYGTGGTLVGVSRVLKKAHPDVKLIVAEPELAPLLGSKADQQRNAAHEPAGSHSAFQSHPIQGWAPDFIPWVLQEAIDKKIIDQVVAVSAADAVGWSRKLAQNEGIFVGISSGGTLAAAMQLAKGAPKGSTFLVMLPDTGERYLSTPLFEGVESVMTEDEIALMKSTPGYHFEPPAS